MQKDSRYIWYMLDMLLFLAINAIILSSLNLSLAEVLQRTSGLSLFFLIAGIWRITDVATHESVSDFIRAPFKDRKMVDGKEVWEISERGFRGVAGTLVSCNACFGVWVSMIVFYLFLFFPTTTIMCMIILTLTFCERFISKIYNYLEKRG